MNDQDLLRAAAGKLHGKGKTGKDYRKLLAKDLRTPEPTIKNYWIGRTRLPGVFRAALRALVLLKKADVQVQKSAPKTPAPPAAG